MTVDLRHGDCLEILPTIPDGSVDMILTDLPYGTTQNKWDSIIPLEPLWEQWKRIIKRGGAVVLFGQQPFTSILVMSNVQWYRHEWIWEKSHPTGFLNAKVAPLKSHENIVVFSERKAPYNPQMVPTRNRHHEGAPDTKSSNYGEYKPGKHKDFDGMNYPRTILRYSTWKDWSHPTQKPVGLCEYLIRTYTCEGETVLDCCMGSGTTGVAAVQCGRSFIGIELDEGYFQTAQRRIADAKPVTRDYMNGQTRLGSFDAEEVGQ